MKLILASESPRRRDILQKAGFSCPIHAVPVEELKFSDDPAALPLKNALLKANAAASDFPDALILGADTVVLHGGRILGKPADEKAAEEMLYSLAGTTHEVVTGIAIVSPANNICLNWSETTSVTFKPFSRADVREYMKLVSVLDKAGAYGIQEHGDLLLEKMDGELENVIGLPIKKLQKILLELGCK